LAVTPLFFSRHDATEIAASLSAATKALQLVACAAVRSENETHATEVSTSPSTFAWPLSCSAVGSVVRRSGARRNVVPPNVVRRSGCFRVQYAQDVGDLGVEAIDATFVRPGAAPCLAAYVSVGLESGGGSSALVVHFRRAWQRTTGPRSGRGATLTAQRRVAHVECSGQWREQREQHQEVWLERSELGYVL
jgi:hypothetical protein